jgi:hypothetical protein
VTVPMSAPSAAVIWNGLPTLISAGAGAGSVALGVGASVDFFGSP